MVDVDEDVTVWCLRCGQLIHTHGKNHVARSTGMAFYKVEHNVLLKALQLLEPGVKLPSSFQLATTFLDDAYSKSLLVMQVELEGQVLAIVTDSWTDMNGLAVISYVAVACKKTYFLESVYTGAQAHDAAFLATDIKLVIDKYEFLHVGAVVTDNMATNKSAWELLQPDFLYAFFCGEVVLRNRKIAGVLLHTAPKLPTNGGGTPIFREVT
ncbi:Transposase putative [Phytophthora palmivora]|uniref:Transposase putative n=1 Tax=Phytophthora palmivora TaxID=4796 RepID=A0A2P4YMB5_9STRA|nr:Transposase putative [Phytophthora palmivora]